MTLLYDNWRQRDNGNYYDPTLPPDWSGWTAYNPGGASVSLSGSEFSRDPVTHKGNFIDALPYYFTTESYTPPSHEALVIGMWGSRKRFEYRGNIGRFAALSPNDFVSDSANNVSGANIALIESLATLKAKAALRRADASIPMMLKERTETLKMLKSHAGRSLDLIRRKQLADVKRYKAMSHLPSNQRKFLAQLIASEHLAFVFGMLPLISELEGLCEFMTRDEHTFIKGRGRMKMNRVTKKVTSYMEGAYTTLTTTTGSYSARCSLRADIDVSILASAQRLGFNPLYTLYDFTPLSFITGWFSNFNYWIQSLDPLIGSTYRTGALTTRSSIAVNRQCYATPTPRNISQGSCKSSGKVEHTKRKVISSDPPSGGLHVYNNLSFFAATTGVSLFVQRKVKLAKTAIAVKPFRYRSKKPVTLPPIRYVKVTK